MTPSSVTAHVDEVTRLQAAGLKLTRKAWRGIDPDDITGSWDAALDGLMPRLELVQYRAAVTGSEYVGTALAEQGLYVPPRGFADPGAFPGFGGDGQTLDDLLRSPTYTAKRLIGEGVSPADALNRAGRSLDRITRTLVADTSRQAAAVDIATRPRVGYIRQLVGTSCPDCVILAGRFYRWNKGFLRHPSDDCVHVPTTEAAASGAVVDPYAHFNAMTAAEQDEFWGAENAAAIRDGADIYQVYNSRRGKKGMHTTAGMGRKSTTRQTLGKGQRRLTPEGIYKQAKTRDEALILLERHGYILPGGQVPGGSIRGPYYEGFGKLGRGGRSKGAVAAVLQARATGIRDPASRYTMTAAERRLADAQARWTAVRNGVNPYGKTPLTAEHMARAEKELARWTRTSGQIWAPKATDIRQMSDDALEKLMEKAMADGDFAKAERLGEVLDAPRLPSGTRIDYNDALRPEVYDWYETATQADRDRLNAGLGQFDRDHFAEAQWQHVTGKTASRVSSKREQREQYETHLETEYLAAEAATNGHMLSLEARLAGRTSRDLWSVNESTARSWASPEMLEYWDAHGRMTWTDWQAMHGGDMGDIQKRSGTWLR